ncbi:hypothetical protein ACSBOX_05855 [Arthrobacter sp. KN11-1C]|uniref:hypothetical protein n=1 Tax=Arthrobacter sp. KN11-1C TaxID=3445774 RepID=UPI003FA070A4
MAEVKFVPHSQWDPLAVQPPAGKWLIRAVPFIKVILAALGVGAPLALIDAATGYAFPTWIPLVPLWLAIALCAVGVVIAVLAIRPYYAERKFGYKTWPERSAALGPGRR